MADACPPLGLLLQADPESATVDHIADCRRCRALRATGPAEPARAVESAAPTSTPGAGEARPGAVVTVGTPGVDENLVAIVARTGEDGITVVPVGSRPELATEWDVLLGRAALGYSALAQVWNWGSILPEQIREPLAELPAADFAAVVETLRASSTSGPPPPSIRRGPPVLDSGDPRLLFQEEETERARGYWEPLLALAGAATLGQLVAHRRAELALDAAQLEEVAAQRGWLGEIEADRADIPSLLTPDALAALMRRLRLGASRRLGRIAAVTIEGHAGPSAALARGKTGARREGPGTAEYVDEFLRRLAEDE